MDGIVGVIFRVIEVLDIGDCVGIDGELEGC